eukprot:g1877.t1
MWQQVQEIHNKPKDATDVLMNMDTALLEVKLARYALHNVIDWIEKIPSNGSAEEVASAVRGAKEKLAEFGLSGTHAIRIPSPTSGKSPRSRWSTTKKMMSATFSGLRSVRSGSKSPKSGKWDGQGQGAGAVEMSSLESKTDSVDTSSGSTKTSSHADHGAKLPQELMDFRPLGEIPDIAACCAKLRTKQTEYKKEFESSKRDGAKLARCTRDLEKLAEKLRGLMLKGIQEYIYEENVDNRLINVVEAGNKHFLDVYTSVFHTIENSERTDIEQYFKSIERASMAIPLGMKSKQVTSNPVELLTHAFETKPKYERIVKDLVKSLVASGKISKGDIQITIAPVKKLQRIVEKSMLKAAKPGDASRTCDLVRGMAICKDMSVICKFVDALTDLVAKKKITRVRLKDRFARASDGGWRDFMDNFIVAGDKRQHVCELQVVHNAMIVARKGLPGHVVYGKVRNAAELSLLYNGGSSHYNFHELLWEGKQQAALAMLFVKCSGQNWHPSQRRGWCTTPNLSKWAGVTLDAQGMVTSLDLSRRKLEGKAGLRMEMLKPLTKLDSISLRESSRHIRTDSTDEYESVGDDEVKVIASSCPNLRVADFDFCSKITDEGIAHVGKSCPALEVIQLQECDLITDGGVKELVSRCPKLTRINIKECDKITDAALSLLGSLKNLRELDVQDCDLISNNGLSALKQLTSLNLNYCCEITDKGLEIVANQCPNLLSISLTELQVSDQGIRGLVEKCKKLQRVCLYQCRRIGDTAVAAIAKYCPDLEDLDIQYCPRVTDASMKLVASSCPQLRDLKIRNCEKVTDAFLEVLVSNCKAIRRVDCFGCPGISDSGVRAASSKNSAIVFDR